uniref:Arm DNA-binding domain-containing protein n=1 Tax=Halomonas sp. TaxID=1486246 RepID=UPI002626795C|nr:DUF3596 domain-containing protein [Halomonas sp.]
MGRKSATESLTPALRELLSKHPGVEVHGPSLRIWFMWRGKRCRESIGLIPTRANIKHAAQQRAAVTHAIKLGTFDYAEWFPDSKHVDGKGPVRNARVQEVAERYLKLKSVDITTDTEYRYKAALDEVCTVIGNDLLIGTVTPEDIQQMRGELAATRQVSTVNNYLATARGFLEWCKTNGYTDKDLAAAAERIRAEDVDPDPFTQPEFRKLIEKGCLHEQDVAALTLAIYTGLRPGEICGLAREDVDLESGCLTVRRSVTRRNQVKVPKTRQSRDRVIWLLPPALEAARVLHEQTKDLKPETTEVAITRHQSRTDTVTPLISPTIQARQPIINRWMNPHTWGVKLTKLMKRADIRHRRPYQTRHTYACWSLTAHGNLAFIAKQMGHKDYSMLVKVYARWIDSESQDEAARIWTEMKKAGALMPMLPTSEG